MSRSCIRSIVVPVIVAGSLALLGVWSSAFAQVKPSGNSSIRLAENAAQCQAWAAQIRSNQSAYQSQCSGRLDPPTYARCQNWRSSLESEIARYNSACGR